VGRLTDDTFTFFKKAVFSLIGQHTIGLQDGLSDFPWLPQDPGGAEATTGGMNELCADYGIHCRRLRPIFKEQRSTEPNEAQKSIDKPQGSKRLHDAGQATINH
jgi:hypothetical protein